MTTAPLLSQVNPTEHGKGNQSHGSQFGNNLHLVALSLRPNKRDGLGVGKGKGGGQARPVESRASFVTPWLHREDHVEVAWLPRTGAAWLIA